MTNVQPEIAAVKDIKIFIIRDRVTKEHFVAQSGKTSWKATGHAKNAFRQSGRYVGGKYVRTRFDDQTLYEIVQVETIGPKRAKQLEEVLRKILDVPSYQYKQVMYSQNAAEFYIHNMINEVLD